MNFVFIDASAYIALLKPSDSHHHQANQLIKKFEKLRPLTTYSILEEVLTVGSMRVDKANTINFVEDIQQGPTLLIRESQELWNLTFALFKKIPSKNIGWVDCFSRVIIDQYRPQEVFTFDKHFAQLMKIRV
jgi:predicted nucleic acid-binding protein